MNDPITDLGREDIDLISDYQEQIEAIILPKIQSFDSLATLATKIAFEDDLIPLIETPRAVATVDEIASEELEDYFLVLQTFLQALKLN